MGELEKLGPKYRIALRIARDERWERLQCDQGVYADDCFVDRVMKHKIYNVATLRGCQMSQRSEASVGHE